MSRRLFHAIVLVGAGMGCSSSDTTPTSTDAKADVVSETSGSEAGADTFPGIMPMMLDSGADSTTEDTFPTIAADTGADTFPGISPVMDSFPGIMPPPSPPP